MKDIITYSDFIGSVHFDSEDMVFHGKIEGIDDLVTFEGRSTNELIKAFHEAVDDYVALCKKAGKEPLKSCKGSFNVRIPSDLHRRAVAKATIKGVSLNELVRETIKKEVA
jgi:predicted HicB family RNase H-like nuclease